MAVIFATEDVRRWWSVSGALDSATKPSSGCTQFVIEFDGALVGFLQLWQESDPEYRHAGIDLVLDPEYRGRGIGPAAIRLAALIAFRERGHHRIVIDPNAENTAAIRAYEKVGFKRVGIMRRYEWSEHHGDWTDGLLMDLLEPDLR